MNSLISVQMANTILYCQKWQETIDFYRNRLGLPVTFATDWFVEFQLAPTARLSIANERRATVGSSRGRGITLTLQVANVHELHRQLHQRGIKTGPVQKHPWGAHVCYLVDPEGHRLEFWSPD